MNAMTPKMNERTTEQAAEHGRPTRNDERRPRRSFEWVPEALALVVVTPALVYGIASLQNLPIV